MPQRLGTIVQIWKVVFTNHLHWHFSTILEHMTLFNKCDACQNKSKPTCQYIRLLIFELIKDSAHLLRPRKSPPACLPLPESSSAPGHRTRLTSYNTIYYRKLVTCQHSRSVLWHRRYVDLHHTLFTVDSSFVAFSASPPRHS